MPKQVSEPQYDFVSVNKPKKGFSGVDRKGFDLSYSQAVRKGLESERGRF